MTNIKDSFFVFDQLLIWIRSTSEKQKSEIASSIQCRWNAENHDGGNENWCTDFTVFRYFFSFIPVGYSMIQQLVGFGNSETNTLTIIKCVMHLFSVLDSRTKSAFPKRTSFGRSSRTTERNIIKASNHFSPNAHFYRVRWSFPWGIYRIECQVQSALMLFLHSMQLSVLAKVWVFINCIEMDEKIWTCGKLLAIVMQTSHILHPAFDSNVR